MELKTDRDNQRAATPRRPIVNGSVQCTRCKKWMAPTRSNFYPSARTALGLTSWCRDCSKKYQKLKYIGTKRLPAIEAVDKTCQGCGAVYPGRKPYFLKEDSTYCVECMFKDAVMRDKVAKDLEAKRKEMVDYQGTLMTRGEAEALAKIDDGTRF